MKKYKVSEIFSSIEGEGIRAGFPATFVRFFGCNLACKWCDSKYAWATGESYKELTSGEIIQRIVDFENKRVTFTGGEPLIHDKFIKAFIYNNPRYEVNIETNGAVWLHDFANHDNNVIITMDYKLSSSGQTNKMILENFGYLKKNDVLKFVIGSKEDFAEMLDILDEERTRAQIFISPVFGAVELDWLADQVKRYSAYNLRMQIQMHKIIWPPDARGV